MARKSENPEDGTKVVIECIGDRVSLKVEGVDMQMSHSFARELGEKLYKCGCDAAAFVKED